MSSTGKLAKGDVISIIQHLTDKFGLSNPTATGNNGKTRILERKFALIPQDFDFRLSSEEVHVT